MEIYYCSFCRDKRVDHEGDLCKQCQQDKGRGYSVITLAGRCANGAERDSGTKWHAVPMNGYKALCGAEPGRHSAGWSSWKIEGQEVTCPRCAKKLAKG